MPSLPGVAPVNSFDESNHTKQLLHQESKEIPDSESGSGAHGVNSPAQSSSRGLPGVAFPSRKALSRGMHDIETLTQHVHIEHGVISDDLHAFEPEDFSTDCDFTHYVTTPLITTGEPSDHIPNISVGDTSDGIALAAQARSQRSSRSPVARIAGAQSTSSLC